MHPTKGQRRLKACMSVAAWVTRSVARSRVAVRAPINCVKFYAVQQI